MSDYLTYNTDFEVPIVGCAISHCGSYLAFNSHHNTLRVVSLRNLPSNSNFAENTNLNDQLNTIFEAQLLSNIKCLEFGKGCISRSRLQQRSTKRRASFAVLDDVCLLAVGLQSGQFRIYSLITTRFQQGPFEGIVENGGRSILILKDGSASLTTISFSLDGSLRMASASDDGKIRLWDMWDDGNMYKIIHITNNFRPYAVAWGNNSRQICIVGSKGKGYIYQSEKPCLKVATLSIVHYNDISSCKYSSDNSLLATSSFDTSVVIWCAGTYKPMLQIWHNGYKPSKIFMGGLHNQFLRDFDFSPDCINFVSVSDDRKIRLWNIEESKEPVEEIIVASNHRQLLLTSIRFLPNGSKYFVSTSDGRLLLLQTSIDTAQSLANLCRKSVRQRVVRKVNQLVQLPNVSQIDPYRSSTSKFSAQILNNTLHEDSESLLEQMSPPSLPGPASNMDADDDDRNPLKPIVNKHISIASGHDLRRHSDSDILRSSASNSLSSKDLLVRDLVDELPLPNALKHYLQFGLPGSEILENNDPRPTRLVASGNRRFSLF